MRVASPVQGVKRALSGLAMSNVYVSEIINYVRTPFVSVQVLASISPGARTELDLTISTKFDKYRVCKIAKCLRQLLDFCYYSVNSTHNCIS